MRLIDADAMLNEHCEGCAADIREGCKTDPFCGSAMWFVEAPTVDAVEVVRCKDCVWYCEKNGLNACNRIYGFTIAPMLPDDYCSYGERKTT